MRRREAQPPVEPPAVMYNARGQATLWLPEGRPRSPADELAGRLGVTTSAVNQQLWALHPVDLVRREQHGRSVLYLRSDLGDALAAPEASETG